MLASMRTLSHSIVSKLLMLLLVVSFGVWGVGDILKSSGGKSYAAKVGGETISGAEFNQRRQFMKRQLESMGFKGLPKGQVEATVLRQLVQQKLAILAMQDLGLYVNDETVARALAANPQFQDENGKFSKARFSFAMTKQGTNERSFVAEFKRELAGRFLTDTLAMDDATAPTSILTLQAIGAGETRDVVLFTVPATDAIDNGNEQAIKAYYDTHKDSDYMRPETRTLEYVVLTDDAITTLAAKAVTEDMVTQAMTERKKTDKAEMRKQLEKEQRDEVTRDLSNTIEDELAAGKKLNEALAKAGLHAEVRTLDGVTADVAKMSADDVTRTVAEQGFSLSEGEISNLVTTKKGTLVLVSAKKVTPAAPKPYEEVKADVRTRLAKELAADAARAKANGVKQALAGAPNWQAVAMDKHASARVMSRVPRAMEGKAPVEGVPPSLQQSIFEHPVGEVAGPLALSNGDQVLALITATHLPQVNAADLKGKDTQAIARQLGQTVEAHAYQAFGDKHHVEVNPAIMREAVTGDAGEQE